MLVAQSQWLFDNKWFTQYKVTSNRNLGFALGGGGGGVGEERKREREREREREKKMLVSEESGVMIEGTTFHSLVWICGCIKRW